MLNSLSEKKEFGLFAHGPVECACVHTMGDASWSLLNNTVNSFMHFTNQEIDEANYRLHGKRKELKTMEDQPTLEITGVEDSLQSVCEEGAADTKHNFRDCELWTVSRNKQSITVKNADPASANVWAEVLHQVCYSYEDRGKQHGIIFKIKDQGKDISDTSVHVTVTVYTSTGRVHVQGLGYTSFANKDLVHLGQQVQARLAGQEATSVPTQSSLDSLALDPQAGGQQDNREGAQPLQPQPSASHVGTRSCQGNNTCRRAHLGDIPASDLDQPEFSSTPIRDDLTQQSQALLDSSVTAVKSPVPSTVSQTTKTAVSQSKTDAKLQDENTKLKQELKTAKLQINKLDVIVHDYRNRLAAQTARNITIEDDLKAMQKRVVAAQKEKVSLIQEIASIKVDIEILETQSQPQPDPDAGSLSDFSAKLRSLCAEVETLKGELHTVRQSAEDNLNPPTKTLLIGASILREVHEDGLEDTDVKCMRGATLARFEKQLGKMDLSVYHTVIVQCSTNDCGPAPDYNVSLAKLVNSLKEKAPHVEIVLSGLCPRADDQKDKVDPYNKVITEFAQADGLKHVQNAKSFRYLDGRLDMNLLNPDKLHLNRPGTSLLLHNINKVVPILPESTTGSEGGLGQDQAWKKSRKHDQKTTPGVAKQQKSQRQAPAQRQQKQQQQQQQQQWQGRAAPTQRQQQQQQQWQGRAAPTQRQQQQWQGRAAPTQSQRGCYHCGEEGHTQDSCRHELPVAC